MQPGETITPGGSPQPTPTPAPPQEQPIMPAAPVPRPAVNDDLEVSWSASEYIAHEKSGSWYAGVILGSAILAALTYLLTSDGVSTGVILLVGVIFGVAAARKPNTLDYGISHTGILVGEKFYPFTEFKSFSVLDEEALSSILLLPMKRFMPGLSIYYPPDQEDEIMTVLSLYLPHENRPVDMVDKLARRLRF